MPKTMSKPVPEGHYAQLPNGYRIHYLDEGSGPVVVMLHGSGTGASGYSNFKGNYKELAKAGYRVILADLVGFGYSDKPDNVEYPLSFFVECLKQALDVIGVSKCTLVGNSLGGAVAIGFALAHPTSVEKLVLMAPGGVSDMPDYQAMPGMAALFAHLATGKPFTHETMKAFFIKAFVVDPAVVDDQLVAERLEMAKLQNPQVMKTLQVPNMTARLGEIKAPTLTLWGINENMMPENGILRLAKGIPNNRVVLVPNCGHWVMMEHRDLFNRTVIDFLRNG